MLFSLQTVCSLLLHQAMKATGKDLVPSASLRNADECKKLLDNGWSLSIWKNTKGSYTAVAIPASIGEILSELEEGEEDITLRTQPHWTAEGKSPSAVLHGLTESVLFGKRG